MSKYKRKFDEKMAVNEGYIKEAVNILNLINRCKNTAELLKLRKEILSADDKAIVNMACLFKTIFSDIEETKDDDVSLARARAINPSYSTTGHKQRHEEKTKKLLRCEIFRSIYKNNPNPAEPTELTNEIQTNMNNVLIKHNELYQYLELNDRDKEQITCDCYNVIIESELEKYTPIIKVLSKVISSYLYRQPTSEPLQDMKREKKLSR